MKGSHERETVLVGRSGARDELIGGAPYYV